jgi:sugar phosphate isomerase/epimerase
MPFRKALPIVASMGVQAVEIDARGELKPDELTNTGLRQVRKWLADHNLKVSAVGFQTRRGYNVPDDLERRIAATKDAMRFAFELGAKAVVNHVGRVPVQHGGPEWDLLIDSLTDLGRFGQKTGALLAIETGAEAGEHLAGLIEALPEGSVGVNFDPGNLIVNGYSPEEAITALARYTLQVHAKDGVRDASQGRGVEVPLGRGSVDFAAIMAALEEADFEGYFTVERDNAREPVEEIRLAVEYLCNL